MFGPLAVKFFVLGAAFADFFPYLCANYFITKAFMRSNNEGIGAVESCGGETITVRDKSFSVSIPERDIMERVRAVAASINRDFEGRNPVFMAVLNGSFVFAADLLREVTVPCEISFVKLASYQGVSTTGDIRELIGLNVDITGRPVIIVEDIVDTGLTMAHMLETLRRQNPSSIDICTLLLKPGKLRVALDIRYCCMEIPNDFIVGYGLDYDGYGRNLRDIYTLV